MEIVVDKIVNQLPEAIFCQPVFKKVKFYEFSNLK